ncbi:hypothetical protein H6801_01330 [Candidatus Nomurabacteria bacterium]|jgi:hypothetical protein|nr:hypothetical protein [Candidatus Saccharibacteria bacterium]MCB9821996.1 hypothetical protein [Candidatus Nomurabacteria bacterium]
MKRKNGRTIIPLGVFPEMHELETAAVFLAQGFDVEFLLPSRIKGIRTPDVKIDNILWEIKCPTGSGKKTVEKQLQRASGQSKNIIFDSRRTKLVDTYIEKELRKQLKLSRSFKKLILITKEGIRLDIKRKP